MKECPVCGSTFDDILYNGIGCVNCYETFKDKILSNFRIHGFENCKRIEENVSELHKDEIERLLEDAIKKEDYEKAAKYRDCLGELKDED